MSRSAMGSPRVTGGSRSVVWRVQRSSVLSPELRKEIVSWTALSIAGRMSQPLP